MSEDTELLRQNRSANWSTLRTAVSAKMFQVGEYDEAGPSTSSDVTSQDDELENLRWSSARETPAARSTRTPGDRDQGRKDPWREVCQMLKEGAVPPETFRELTGHRGELTMIEKYDYDLSKAQLKASSRTSALLAGFAMVALVELQYDSTTPRSLLIILGVVTTLLVSVHLLALMMSTCILPYMEAAGCSQDSPHKRLKFYIDLSWLFSTCIGLLLFLIEIGVIFFVKFAGVDYLIAAYITTAMLVPVMVVFVVFSWLIHRSRFTHSLNRFEDKLGNLRTALDNFGGVPQKNEKSNNGIIDA